MKLKKVIVNKIPIEYESSYKYKFQTKLILFWWTLRIGRIQRITVKNNINSLRNWKFWLVIIPEFVVLKGRCYKWLENLLIIGKKDKQN